MKSLSPLFVIFLFLLLVCPIACPTLAQEERQEQRPDENVYKGELVAFPGPWSFSIPKVSIILTSDEDLEILSSDPDRVIDMSLTFDKDMSSLRAKCEAAKNMGGRTLIVAFDHFFQQYRPGQDTERRLMPDMDEYIEKMAKIARFAEQYGLGLELSLLTPLEIGRAYRRDTGECGVWMQYRKGLRDPKTGSFSVELWRQNRWANNKGVFDIEEAGVRVFAFKEAGIHGTPYRAVNEQDIVEIKDGIQVEVLGEPVPHYQGTRIRVFGKTPLAQGGLNRVLIVQSYKTPEMDYFSDEAGKYLKKLVDRYADAGIRLNALYSDEPHLMGDWGYHNHHDHGQFTLRYVSPGFADKFAKKFGEKYRDFAKYLVYFTYGQEDFAHDLSATEGIMHTFGASPVDVRQTALFRARYYRFLQDGLADLLINAKHHAERRMGQRLESRAHATWAESPTCDAWLRSQGVPGNAQKYEYTSDFIWSNTVQQSAVACSDYFRWGDFLTGNGNDHAEGGYLDRNYFGLALACSTGILNEIPFSYGAHWGMPDSIAHRRHMVAQTFGALQSVASDVQDFQHRDVDVLMLYPLDLVAVDEQFGSWTNQYGYCNYITQQKLVDLGTVNNGSIELAGRRFTTLVATFEPFPDPKLLSMMQQLVEQGGKVIWSGPVPLLTSDGKDAYATWTNLFGIEYAPIVNEGIPLPGRQINFRGSFQSIAPQIILSHFLVDHVYTVADSRETEVVATIGDRIVGTVRHFPNGGSATFLGFRPLDNQACSLGYDTRTWFDILTVLGAYHPSGRFLLDDNQTVLNDNTEFLSRTGDYIVCRFPNGTISVAPHLKNLEEDWDGGFARNQERDAEVMKRVVLPSDQVQLNDFKVNGHLVHFAGTNFLSFRLDPEKNLLAFAGQYMKQLTIDGKTFTFADEPIPLLMFAPVPQERQIPNGAIFEIQVHGTMPVRIPASGLPQSLKVFANGATLGSKGHEVPVEVKDGVLHLSITPNESGRTLWVVPN